MKIVFITNLDIGFVGGVQTNVRQVAIELVKLGHTCTVICGNPGYLKDKELINGVQIIRFKSSLQKLPLSLKPAIINYVKKHMVYNLKPDIVHVHGYRTLLVPMVTYELNKLNIPYVLSPHYDVLGYNTLFGKYLINFYNPVFRKSLEWAKAVIVNSYYTKYLIKNNFPSSTNNLVVIPHGVDEVSFRGKMLRKGIENKINIVYAGVLIEKKGVQFLLKTMFILKKLGEPITLTIIGEGDYKKKLELIADNLKINNYIKWLPPLYGEEYHKVMKNASLFILTSKDESYGIAVAEALARGTPAVVSTNSALNEFLIEPGCFGISYPPDPVTLAMLIKKLSHSDVIVGPLVKIKTWKEVAKLYEQLYMNFIEK